MTSNDNHLRAPKDVEILVSHIAAHNVYTTDNGIQRDVAGAVDIATEVVREVYSRGISFEETFPTPIEVGVVDLDEFASSNQGGGDNREGLQISWSRDNKVSVESREELQMLISAVVKTWASNRDMRIDDFIYTNPF